MGRALRTSTHPKQLSGQAASAQRTLRVQPRQERALLLGSRETLTTNDVITLQRTAGNRAVNELMIRRARSQAPPARPHPDTPVVLRSKKASKQILKRAAATVGDTAAHRQQGLRGLDKISEHLIPGAIQRWVGMIENGPAAKMASKVISEVSGRRSLYTKENYLKTITIVLEKSVAAVKTKADMGMITLVRHLALAGGLTKEDLRMIYDGQRDMIAHVLRTTDSKVTMKDIAPLLEAQEREGFGLLAEKARIELVRKSGRLIKALGGKGKLGAVLAAMVGAGALLAGGRAEAKSSEQDPSEGVPIDLPSMTRRSVAAKSSSERQTAATLSLQSKSAIRNAMRDTYKKWNLLYQRHHSFSLMDTLKDPTTYMSLPMAVFFYEGDNYEIAPKWLEDDRAESLRSIKLKLEREGIETTPEDDNEILSRLDQMQMAGLFPR